MILIQLISSHTSFPILLSSKMNNKTITTTSTSLTSLNTSQTLLNSLSNNYYNETSIPLSILINLLTCSICRDILTDTCTGITCLHRYCFKCIEKYIISTQSNDRSCPYCRCKIASRRQFKIENKFCDLIINNIFKYIPIKKNKKFDINEYKKLHKNRNELMLEQAKLIANNNNNYNNNNHQINR